MTTETKIPPLSFLCVDDNLDFIAYLKYATDSFNVILDTCNTIAEAKRKLDKSSYDGFIIDLNLPDGSGFDLLQEIRKKVGTSRPIVVISGVYRDAESFRLLKEKYSIEYVLGKPVYFHQVESLFNDLFSKYFSHPKAFQAKLLADKEKYDQTICEQIELITTLVKAIQVKKDEDTLSTLKEAIHKIGISAWSYGYSGVSQQCKELELRIKERLSLSSKLPTDEAWLASLNEFINKVKYNFQVNTIESRTSSLAKKNLSRASLYVVEGNLKFLEQLVHEKEQFPIDLSIDSDPEKAVKRLSAPDFNPRALIVSQFFPGSTTTGFDIIDSLQRKPNALSTIFGVLLDSDTVQIRLDAMQKKIKYIFRKPISPQFLMNAMANALGSEHRHDIKVLVLDDDPTICQFAIEVLNDIGIDVRAITDPNQLFLSLDEFVPDVLLLDIAFPKHDGVKLLKLLRADATYRTMTIVVITSSDDPSLKSILYSEDADEILYKPIDKGILQKRVLNLARRKTLLKTAVFQQPSIGLDQFDELIVKLRSLLMNPGTVPYYLAIVALDYFDELMLQKGYAYVNKILVQISNLIHHETDHNMISFFYGESKFAILFESNDISLVERTMNKLLLRAQSEITVDLAFDCGVVPVSKAFQDAFGIIAACENALKEGRNKGVGGITVTSNSPSNEMTKKKTVIIIDPDQNVLQLLKTALESSGIIVKTFMNGQKAQEYLANLREAELPDLIISEKKLGQMDGIEILSWMRTNFKNHIPFFFLTIITSDSEIQEGLKKGALCYITKPFNLPNLMQKVNMALFESPQIQPRI